MIHSLKKTVGLSIHSVGLDFAYNLTRQSNTHTDFRFVPSFEEIRTLIKSKKQRSLIFEIPNKQLQEVNIKKWKWQNIENLPKGCYLYGRCAHQQEKCKDMKQELKAMDDGRFVGCWTVSEGDLQ